MYTTYAETSTSSRRTFSNVGRRPTAFSQSANVDELPRRRLRPRATRTARETIPRRSTQTLTVTDTTATSIPASGTNPSLAGSVIIIYSRAVARQLSSSVLVDRVASAFKRRAGRLKRRRARSFLPRWARGQPAGFAEGRARSIGCASFVKLRGILNRQSRAERQNRTKLTVKLNKLQIILTEHDCRM